MSRRRGSYVPRNNLSVALAPDTQVVEPRPPVPVVLRPSPITPLLDRLANQAPRVLVALAVLAFVWIKVPGLSYASFGCCIVALAALAGFWVARRRGESQSCILLPFPAETFFASTCLSFCSCRTAHSAAGPVPVESRPVFVGQLVGSRPLDVRLPERCGH